MAKVKLLYDIEQLLLANGKETGICRVSLEILKQLTHRKDYEVYPIVTTDKGMNPQVYLEQKGLKDLVPNIVSMPYLKKTTQPYNLYKIIRCWLLQKKYAKGYLKELNRYDEYISLFSPISPLVYDSHLKTKIIIHDLIPILFPSLCTPNFVKKFRSWIKQVRADEVICVSDATQQDFLKLRPDYATKVTKVAYLAADSAFRPVKDSSLRKRYHIPTKRYFLAVSDHNPRKNYRHTVDAFILFLKQTGAKDVSLVFVGPKGRGFETLREHISHYADYADKIVCTGFVADKDMPALYSEASLFLYPSLYEGFGLPILEAMSCGTPVVTCNNSSLPEVGGDAAVYISGKNVAETARLMEMLYRDKKKCQSMSRAGLLWAKQFTWDKTVHQIFG